MSATRMNLGRPDVNIHYSYQRMGKVGKMSVAMHVTKVMLNMGIYPMYLRKISDSRMVNNTT